MIMLDKIVKKMKVRAVVVLDNVFWKTDPALCWWKGDLTTKERFVRFIKQLDAWLLDLIYPKLDE